MRQLTEKLIKSRPNYVFGSVLLLLLLLCVIYHPLLENFFRFFSHFGKLCVITLPGEWHLKSAHSQNITIDSVAQNSRLF